MVKDYATKRRSPAASSFKKRITKTTPYHSPEASFSGWIWMSAGLFLGLLLAGMMYWKFHLSPTPHPAIASTSKTKIVQKKKIPSAEKASTQRKAESPRFDFYTLLPSMTMDLPDSAPLANVAAAPLESQRTRLSSSEKSSEKSFEKSSALPESKPRTTPQPPAVTTHADSYIIQVGSFRQLPQAEKLKAQLALAGHEASIQTIKISEKGRWYRVYLGPLSGKEKALWSQQKLEQAQQFHSVVLRMQV